MQRYLLSAWSLRKVLSGRFYWISAHRHSASVHSLRLSSALSSFAQLSPVVNSFLVTRDPAPGAVRATSGKRTTFTFPDTPVCVHSTTALAGHAVRSYCKFMSNLTLRSLSALLLSRILPPFECLCFKLRFPGCTGLHFPMNVTVIFQLYIFNHSTSTFITSAFIDASSSFRCMGIRTLKIGL